MSIDPAPDQGASPPVLLERPPESMRPDRPEIMIPVGSGMKFALERGVVFECLVGVHNKARNLTTGIVTFASGAELTYHAHPFSESITLLRGSAVVEVEGRCHQLGPLDNVVIPRNVAHYAKNQSNQEPAVFHIAMPTETPTRIPVDRIFSRRSMPDPARAPEGAEVINRFKTARRFEAGPHTEFIDFFNKDLMPGIEMSGGFGLFHPRGRLPAHMHDFDESICILVGEATCVVEGRRYLMADYATALQPRGRVHYFINESSGPMSMLWVYAGPTPERLVVDERYATAEGNPWR